MDMSPCVTGALRCLVVSPELTVLAGRGPFPGASIPDGAVALAFAFGSIDVPATLCLAGASKVAELVGVVALGVFLLLFKRANSFSVFFDSLGAADHAPGADVRPVGPE